jgi:NAD(P)-dependent dehydrogenase (short-subunit alcohol dehydrogenase family)
LTPDVLSKDIGVLSLGTQEIARVITFLASSHASFITSECVTVDDGWSVASVSQHASMTQGDF